MNLEGVQVISVRDGNATSAQQELLFYWFADFGTSQLIVDEHFSYPYFANNVFLIRTEKYREARRESKRARTSTLQLPGAVFQLHCCFVFEVIQHSKCCSRTDEVTMNALRHEEWLGALITRQLKTQEQSSSACRIT